MPRKPRLPAEGRKARRPPAPTPEGREAQLVNLAVDRAEQQIRDGTASAQVITHFLKLGSGREQLERERLRRENLLLEAKVSQIESQQRIEELYADALKAMRSYSGEPPEEVEPGD
jgi:hypothetical protein